MRVGPYIEGVDGAQALLFSAGLGDWVDDDNTVRVIEVFADGMQLAGLGFERAAPVFAGRPVYHRGTLLKISFYGHLNHF